MTATVDIDERRVRVPYAEAHSALANVLGRAVVPARARLRYGPGRTCEPLARVLDGAINRAEMAGLDPARLVVALGSIEPDEDIVRVRRKAHGKADFFASATSHVRIVLEPAEQYAIERISGPTPNSPVADAITTFRGCKLDSSDARTAEVHEVLFDVIDPDLGVNIVDLGFVRAIRIEGRTAVITMTLTSAACPLTRVMEDQIRTELAGRTDIDDFRIDWVWLPAWQPSDITDSGREQLHAIGFTI